MEKRSVKRWVSVSVAALLVLTTVLSLVLASCAQGSPLSPPPLT